MGSFRKNVQVDDLHGVIVRLATAHERKRVKVTLSTACAFVLSSWLTAKGMLDNNIEAGVATPEGMITAAMTAGVAATLVGTATILLFGVATEAVKRQRWHVAALAAFLTPFVLGISTWNAVIGNAGPPSLVYDMREKAAVHAEYYKAAEADASSALSAAAALEPLQSSICTLADKEVSGGVLSGAPGKGAVHAAYVSGCASIGTIIQTLRSTDTRADARRSGAAQILRALEAIPGDTTLSVFERQAAFRAKAGELRKLVDDSGAENVADRLRAQLDILQASVATLGVKDSAYGQTQAGNIDGLKASLTKVRDVVSDLLAGPGGPQAGAAAGPPPELLSMGTAVLKYWSRNIPQILIAVMSDVMMLWFTALLVVSKDTLEIRRKGLNAARRATRRRRSRAA